MELAIAILKLIASLISLSGVVIKTLSKTPSDARKDDRPR